MKRIILLAAVLALMAAMIATSAMSVTAQVDGQYASDGQYSSTTGQAAPVCAPWSKEWNISKGKWWYEWYRWCYDPATSDPAYAASWYRESGGWKWGEPANLCPESGSCTMSTEPGGNVQMTTDTT